MAYRRPLKKRILDSKAVHFLLSWILSLALRVIYLTCRKEVHVHDDSKPYLHGIKPAVFCFWHGRMIMQLFMKPPHRPTFVLSSHHNDGALIVEAMKRFGIRSIRGSRNQGGAHALRNLMHITELNGNISITPDGPRGPFQKAAGGAAFVASKTHYPLIFSTFSATRYWRLRSWDKFMIPKPFSRVHYIISEPHHLTSDAPDAVATTTLFLQEELSRITAEADCLCGVVP